VDLNKAKFHIAFGVRNYNTKEFKDDASFVEWEVHVSEGDGEQSKLT
jgi:hypothetical protein